MENTNQRGKKAAKKSARKEKLTLKCDLCGKRGHVGDDCFKKKEMEKALTVTNANTSQARDQQVALAAYLTSLKNGTAPAQHMITIAAMKVPQLLRDPVGRDGERIGEASHPGPTTTNMGMQVSRFSVLRCLLVSIGCALSVCNGMGCRLVSLRANNVDSFDRYLAVEISEDAHRIAKNANPHIEGKLKIDRS